MAQQEAAHIHRVHLAVAVAMVVIELKLDERRIERDARATHVLDRHRQFQFSGLAQQFLVNHARAARDATRAQADAGFTDGIPGRPGVPVPSRNGASFFRSAKILDQVRNLPGLDLTVNHVVNLGDGGQHAAAEAGDLLHGEFAVGIGVLAVRDLQLLPEGVTQDVGSIDMAGRAGAGPDDMLADGVMPKLRVKGRNACDGVRRDLRDLREPFERRRGQVVKALLDGLQQRDEILGPAPDARHDGVHLREVERQFPLALPLLRQVPPHALVPHSLMIQIGKGG